MDNEELVSNPQEELDKAAKAATSPELTRLAHSIVDIAEEISTTTTPKATVPEIIFVTYFLPFFRNFNKATDTKSPLLYKWIELSTSPYKEVDVVDMANNVLYTVPPIYRSEGVSPEKIKDVPFNKVMHKHKAISAVVPEQGTNYLNAEMSKLPKFVTPAEQVTDDKQRWIAIFKRYPKSADGTYYIPAPEEKPTVTQPVSKPVEKLDLDYDD